MRLWGDYLGSGALLWWAIQAAAISLHTAFRISVLLQIFLTARNPLSGITIFFPADITAQSLPGSASCGIRATSHRSPLLHKRIASLMIPSSSFLSQCRETMRWRSLRRYKY
jgi:hypothetical protein